MKFGLPAKLAIILMVASPFAYAEFECLPLAGTTLFMSVSGANGCPQRSFKLVNGTQCEVVLHHPQCNGVEGEWFATYRYTGSVFNQNPTDPDNPSNPVPDDLSEIRQPRQYVGEDAANFSNAQYYSENSLLAATSVIFRNQNSLYQNIADRLSNHDQDIKSSLQNNVSAVNSLGANFSTSLDRFDASNKAFHEKTYEAQALAQQSLDNLPNLSFGIEALCPMRRLLTIAPIMLIQMLLRLFMPLKMLSRQLMIPMDYYLIPEKIL
ncbi:hypothetical protein WH43_17570 [Rheinheimera sp. KL1]|nr:hypothetical protein WH43_17570 [Rheinheimera sp. KL1]